MKEIVTRCDVCKAIDVQALGTEYRLGVGARMRAIDLCDEHAAEIVKPLEELLDRFGATLSRSELVEPVPPGRKSFPCLWCERSFTTNAGFGEHVHKSHGGTGSPTEILGLTCPICADTFQLGAALSRHIGTAHDLPSIPAAMLYARDNGDAHGIAGAVIAALPPSKTRRRTKA